MEWRRPIVLISALLLLHVRANAEDQAGRASSLTESGLREAASRVLVAHPVPASDLKRSAADPSLDADWSAVRALTQGTEIRVAVRGELPRRRQLIDANDAELTLLKLDEPTLPESVRDALRDALATGAPFVQAACQGQTFYLDHDVRLGPDGVFRRDHKIVELSDLVESVPRTDVAEIAVRAKHSPGRDALVGFIVGSAVYGAVGGALCTAHGVEGCVKPVLGIAALGGGVMAGVSLGAGALKHRIRPTDRVIYRAP